MKFVLSDKNRSINAFLNFLYFFFVVFFVGIFAMLFSMENPNWWSGNEEVNATIFWFLFFLWGAIFFLPVFLKQFSILKIVSIIPLIPLVYFIFDEIKNSGYYNSLFSGWNFILLFLLFFAVFIFVMADFKEKYFQKKL